MRAPADLVGVVGCKEIIRSLGTKNPADAKRVFARVRSETEAAWANLRQGPREARALAAEVGDQWLDAHRANPSQQTFWDTKVGATLWSRPQCPVPKRSRFELQAQLSAFDMAERPHFVFARRSELDGWCFDQATILFTQKGL